MATFLCFSRPAKKVLKKEECKAEKKRPDSTFFPEKNRDITLNTNTFRRNLHPLSNPKLKTMIKIYFPITCCVFSYPSPRDMLNPAPLPGQ